MLLDDYARVSEAPTQEALQASLVSFAEGLDFPLITATLVTDRPKEPSVFMTVSNTPQAFIEAAHDVPDSQRDPVLAQLKVRSTPVMYDQGTYVRAQAADLWEEQAAFGYRTGVAIALHLPRGQHLLLGVDRDKPLPKSSAKLTRLVADLQLLAAHVQDAAVRLLSPPAPEVVVPSLTPREHEVLRWIMQAKSDWDIGRILGVSEHTVDFYVRQILRKLEVRNRHAAVQRAIVLGLL